MSVKATLLTESAGPVATELREAEPKAKMRFNTGLGVIKHAGCPVLP